MSTSSTLEFFDPHFHIWDVSSNDVGGASHFDKSILFAPETCKVEGLYDVSDYESDISGCSGSGFVHSGGVQVEGMSVQHAGLGAKELNLLCLEEAKWTVEKLSASGKTYNLVASACLEDADVDETLKALTAFSTKKVKIVGIRQILNHEPSWPRNTATGNLVANAQWAKGFALLAKHGLSFDAQLNPSQLAAFVEISRAHPQVPVVLNHIGTPTPALLGDESLCKAFFEDLKGFASLPQNMCKLSMMCYTCPTLEKETLQPMLEKYFALFGSKRLMFASNYPVDLKDGWHVTKLLTAAQALLPEGLSEADKQAVFATTAKTFYKVWKKKEGRSFA